VTPVYDALENCQRYAARFPREWWAKEILRFCAEATPPNAPPNASGCDFCRNPLFAGTKCKNCGRNAPPNSEGTAKGADGEGSRNG
jgi:hypothetical protein